MAFQVDNLLVIWYIVLMEKTEKQIISEHMSKLGKKGAAVNKKKGSEYFKWVRSHGKKKLTTEELSKSAFGGAG